MMDRSAPVYYVAVRRPIEPKVTEDAQEPAPRPKPSEASVLNTQRINTMCGALLALVVYANEAILRDLTFVAIKAAFAAAKSKQRSDIKAAINAVERAANRTGFTMPKEEGIEKERLVELQKALIALYQALKSGNGRGGRGLGDRGTRPKPSTAPVDVSERILSLTYEDNERKTDRLTLTVDNFDLSQFDDPLFARGNIIEFTYGYASALAPIREAVIRKVTGGAQLTVEAHGKDVIMDRVKRRQTWMNVRRSDVVREVADRNGYTEEQLAVDETSVVYEAITQPNLTDAQFLAKLARKEGFEFFVDYDGFHWHERNVEQAPLREFVYYTDPGEGDILPGWSIENDLTRKPARVRVKGKDPTTGEVFTAVADDSTYGERTVLQPTTVTESLLYIDPVSGATSQGTRQVDVSQPVAHELDIAAPVQTKEEAEVVAKKIYRKAQQVAVKFRFTSVGDPLVVGKSVILVSGMGTRVSGKYYIQQVVHQLAGGGSYTMALKCITDGFAASQRRKAGSKGQEEANLSLEAALRRLQTAGEATSNPELRKAVASALQRMIPIKQSLLDPASASRGAALASSLVATAQAVGKGDTGGQKDAGKAVVHAAASLAGVFQRIAKQGDNETANAKVNDKPVQSQPEKAKEARLRIDPVTGQKWT